MLLHDGVKWDVGRRLDAVWCRRLGFLRLRERGRLLLRRRFGFVLRRVARSRFSR
jgi:hypothetical protein